MPPRVRKSPCAHANRASGTPDRSSAPACTARTYARSTDHSTSKGATNLPMLPAPPPNPAEKTRTRTSSGAEGGYLGAVWREVSVSGSRWMRSMGTPALEGIIDEGTATKIGGAKAHWPNIGWRVPALGPDCETGRRRAHLRFGRRTGWRVFEQARTMVPHHPRCGGRPERCSRADDNKLITGFAVALRKVQEELVASGFSGKGFANYGAL